MSEELKAHEGRIAYCIWHGITMGRKAGKSGAALMSGGDMVSDEQYAKDVAAQVMKESATLLSALAAAEARAEAAEARAENLDALVDARHDLAYANGFRAGWNAGVAYEQCQPVPFERKASGNPEYHLQTLATMDRRSADALAILAARTLKGAPDGR